MEEKRFNDLYDITKAVCVDLPDQPLRFCALHKDFVTDRIWAFFVKHEESFPGILRKILNKPMIKFISYRVNFNIDELERTLGSAKQFVGYIKKEINKASEVVK